MKRVVIAPTPLPASALAELKEWLGINSTREDALLTILLGSALELCESYTGTRPIEALCEEIWPVRPHFGETGWQQLSTRPVGSISSIEAVTANGERIFLPTDAYAVDLGADGEGRFRVIDGGGATRVAVRFTAGLASRWDSLPAALRQGVIRMAAHHHRSRDEGSAATAPPAAVAALWHAWRRMRLS
jgi:uncharacterized phiE125 gp8 family phage protein